MTSNRTTLTLSSKRRKTDLSPSDIDARLRGAHTFDQVKLDFDLPEPDYAIRGKPFWTADTFEPWFEKYLSDGEARVQAHAQWLECEEARLRDQHRQKDAVELRAGGLKLQGQDVDGH